MKKMIALVLALAMSLSLCACGGNDSNAASHNADNTEMQSTTEADGFKDILCSEIWRMVATHPFEYTLSFNTDGTGILKYADSTTHFTWTADNDVVALEYPATIISDGKLALDVVTEEDIIKLVPDTKAYFYVLESKYEIAKKSVMEEVSVEIINNDGEAESISASELIKIRNNNEVLFKNKYFGAQVTVVSEVATVHGATIYNGHEMEAYVELKGGWVVEAESENDVVNLNPGDLVKITGNIFSAFSMNVDIYIVNGHTTTIELYTES